MDVNVISATEKPMDVVSLAAGCCYGNSNVSEKRVWNCYKLGHMSVFEHASFTVVISGISRACANQLVRHRLASYNQASMRYMRIDVQGDDWYVTPPTLAGNEGYTAAMREAGAAYSTALKSGIPPEDARFMLPLATKTTVTMTCNLREFLTILGQRLDHTAQWEIRAMCWRIVDEISRLPQWGDLLSVIIDDMKVSML